MGAFRSWQWVVLSLCASRSDGILTAIPIRNDLSHSAIDNEQKGNKPDRATMRPDCVSACIDIGAKYVTYMEIQMDRQLKRQSEGGSENTFVDH